MNRFLNGLALFIVVFCVSATGRAAEEPKFWTNDPVCHTIFYAVVEGLYADGVTNDDVDCIIRPDPKTQASHFVYACPLCSVTHEAFALYRSRPKFSGLKADLNTFGKGLDPTISKRLHSADRTERMIAIQELVEKWVAKRLDSMRLTAEEKTDWRLKLDALREQGMNRLKQGGSSQVVGWKTCAICDGCATAGGNKCERPAVMPFGEFKAEPKKP